MAGTRKLEKFELGSRAESQTSGTRRLERFDLHQVAPVAAPAPAAAPARLSMATPIEAIPQATLAAALPSAPPPPLHSPMELPAFASAIMAEMDAEMDPFAGPDADSLSPPRGSGVQSARASSPAADERDSEPRVSNAPRSVDREPGIERLRTRLARKFTTVADEVTASFAELQIGAGAWQPELTAPEGMSTRNGSRGALQLRLRPKRQGHHVLVGGFVDPNGKVAELRSYAAMVAAHDERFGNELAIGFTDAEWEQFLRRAEVVLRAVGIVSKRVVPSAREMKRAKRRKKRFSNTTIAAAVLGFVAPSAAVVIWRVLTVLMHH